MEKRQCSFANVNDLCLCIYELIAIEMKNPYPCFTFTVKSKSQIAIFVAISPFISNISFYRRFIPIFLTRCLKVVNFKYFSLLTSMERSISTIKRNKEKYSRIVMTSQLSVLLWMAQEADSEFQLNVSHPVVFLKAQGRH